MCTITRHTGTFHSEPTFESHYLATQLLPLLTLHLRLRGWAPGWLIVARWVNNTSKYTLNSNITCADFFFRALTWMRFGKQGSRIVVHYLPFFLSAHRDYYVDIFSCFNVFYTHVFFPRFTLIIKLWNTGWRWDKEINFWIERQDLCCWRNVERCQSGLLESNVTCTSCITSTYQLTDILCEFLRVTV